MKQKYLKHDEMILVGLAAKKLFRDQKNYFFCHIILLHYICQYIIYFWAEVVKSTKRRD